MDQKADTGVTLVVSSYLERGYPLTVHEDGRRFQVLVSQHDGAVEVSPLRH